MMIPCPFRWVTPVAARSSGRRAAIIFSLRLDYAVMLLMRRAESKGMCKIACASGYRDPSCFIGYFLCALVTCPAPYRIFTQKRPSLMKQRKYDVERTCIKFEFSVIKISFIKR
jgi:hypothetical protein